MIVTMSPLKQLIPSDICLSCQVCCRFPSPESSMFPIFTQEEMKRHSLSGPPQAVPYHGKSGQPCACPFFNPVTQECAIYPDRPLDCQLYPFVLIYGPTRKRILLGLDTQCPFVQNSAHENSLIGYSDYLRDILADPQIVESIAKTPELVKPCDETILPLYPLSPLTEKFFHTTLFGPPPPVSLGFSPLTLKDMEFFPRGSFIPLFVFSDLLHFYWKKEGDALFVVAEQGNHFFLPIPPITKKLRAVHLEQGFYFLNHMNQKGSTARIEGLSEEDLSLAKELGCAIHPKSPDYIYRRKDLAELTGNAYKSKRALVNYFTKNYHFTYEPYRAGDRMGCLYLFKAWQDRRAALTKEDYELALLEDAASVHRRVLLHTEELGIQGRVVKIAGEVKGYTFGYPLDEKTFCVFLEITDTEVKGLSQFLFREFCGELKEFEWMNAMDDSGLESLRRVKESYRPTLKKISYAVVKDSP